MDYTKTQYRNAIRREIMNRINKCNNNGNWL